MEDGANDVQSLHLNLQDDCEPKEDGLVSTDKVEKMKEEQHLGHEAKGSGGGLIDNLISTLITPSTPTNGKVTEHESGNQDFKSEEGASHVRREGGFITNLVSNFFHQTEAEDGLETHKDKEDEEIIAAEKIKRLKTENEAKDDDRGIIHNMVSHFPSSIPDDAVPTADEATILINSIVRD